MKYIIIKLKDPIDIRIELDISGSIDTKMNQKAKSRLDIAKSL